MRTLRFASLIVLMLAIAVPAAAQSQTQAQQSNSQTQAQQSSGLTLDQVIQAVSVAPQLFARGAAAASAGKNDQALVDYSLFLLMNPTLSEGYVGRAQVYEAMGNLDQALQD